MQKLLLALALTLSPVFAYSATYYVAPSGQSGCSQNANSPQGGINNGIGCLSGGDTLIAKSGTYQGPINIGNVPNGPSDSARTTLRAEEPRRAVIAMSGTGQHAASFSGKQNITLDGFTFDGNNNTATGQLDFNAQNGLANITVQNGEIRNMRADDRGTQQGGYLTTCGIGASWTATNVLIRNMYVHDIGMNCAGGNCCNECYGYGIYLSGNGYILDGNEFANTSGWIVHGYSGGSNSASNNILRNNYFHDSGGPVLLCQSNNQIYSNVLARLGTIGHKVGAGIQLSLFCSGQPSMNNQIYNNTIYQSAGTCIDLGGSTSGTVRNNICYQNGSDAVKGGSGNAMSNNLLGTNPMFVNAAGGDFHLQAGSPAIDAGMPMPNMAYTGTAPDIGAMESGEGSPPPQPTQPAGPLAPTNLKVTGE
jgi:parallel beta-helix repeat protein